MLGTALTGQNADKRYYGNIMSIETEQTENFVTLYRSAFKEFGESALGLEREHFRLLLGGGLSAIGTQVARQARRFDAAVSIADILQASRNAWTACGLQLLLGKSMRLTPSIFAYSMLYPYTDNYLDDPAVSPEQKAGFGARFGRRLNGEPCEPAPARLAEGPSRRARDSTAAADTAAADTAAGHTAAADIPAGKGPEPAADRRAADRTAAEIPADRSSRAHPDRSRTGLRPSCPSSCSTTES